MEKLRFAIQVITFILALPVYFYAELSHDTNEAKAVTQKSTTVEVNYTKNGKDRTPHEAVNGIFKNNPFSITASNMAK